MLISHNWLKKYFTQDLPDIKTIENTFTMGIFEIESVEENKGDTIFDVKVLPDRAHYCLSHRYVAQELGALLNIKTNLPIYDSSKIKSDDSLVVNVNVVEQNICPRYIARRVELIRADESPEWLRNQLESLGQRSINVIVDLTNYIMLETGQPLHAFDADKVEGNINVRYAMDGEIITLLDGTEVKLSNDILVIADDNSALAIAGVKGGKKAEVTESTTKIIIESANFESVSVRKTSQKVGIKNESSKRYENKVTPERTSLAMDAISEYLFSIFPSARFGKVTDVFSVQPENKNFMVSISEISNRIGLKETLNFNQIKDLLLRCDISIEEVGDQIKVFPAEYRLDLEISLDIVDEVGRLLNYMNLIPVELPTESNRPVLKSFYYVNILRMIFKELGFSEVYNHSLKEKGDVAILNPLNIERGFMRNTISESLMDNLELNLRHSDLIGLDSIKIFEVGNIFGGKKERLSFAFGVVNAKKVKGYNFTNEVDLILSKILENNEFNILNIESLKSIIKITESNVGTGGVNASGNVCEIELQKMIDMLPSKESDIFFESPKLIKYNKYSQYPFMVRDISVFTPGEATKSELIKSIIIENGTELLSSIRLFDIYTKNKEDEPVKTSYALRLVFQSEDRTLTDEEINKIMQNITDNMNSIEGWEVR